MTDEHVDSNKEQSWTSSTLLQRVMLHDQPAWERLVSLYSPLIYRWCLRWGLQPPDAENVGQEVFIAVQRKLPDFRRDREGDSFRKWLRVIAHNKALDHFRRTQTEPTGVGGSDMLDRVKQLAFEDDEQTISEETTILYHRAIELIRAEFSDRVWLAFRRVVMEEAHVKDVAHELDVSDNVVYLARSRILRRLREEFADLIDSSSG